MNNQDPKENNQGTNKERRLDDVEDMTASLFADLFYNQVMMERERKAKEKREKKGAKEK